MLYYKKEGGTGMIEQKKILVWGLIGILIYSAIKFNFLRLVFPFVVAWILASLLNPIVTKLNKKLLLPRGLGTIVSMLTILSGILWVIVVLVRQLWHQIVMFSSTFPQYSQKFMEGFDLVQQKIGAFSGLDHTLEQSLSAVGTFLTSRIPHVYHMIIKLPNMILFVIVMLISTFFMTKDYYPIKAFIKAQFSDTIVDKIVLMQRGMLGALMGYIKTQLILMMITFTICLIGLLLFNMDYALLISSIIALVDALPFFGSGSILIPWSLYHFVTEQYVIGVGLLGIYGVIFIMRQIMEPKILSQQINLYALVTVMAMYIGYKLLGILGLILGPLIMVILKTLQDIGVLPAFKSTDYKEYKEIKTK